jgi:Flp pilus assembly pilin Flp
MKNEYGQGLLEFALLLFLVAVIAIACYVVFAPQIHAVWQQLSILTTL